MLSVIMLSVIMLSVIMLSVILLSVIMLTVDMLSDFILYAECRCAHFQPLTGKVRQVKEFVFNFL
jgi:hypothetical protein